MNIFLIIFGAQAQKIFIYINVLRKLRGEMFGRDDILMCLFLFRGRNKLKDEKSKVSMELTRVLDNRMRRKRKKKTNRYQVTIRELEFEKMTNQEIL